MSYQPVIPVGGNAGWAFLQRTRETQQEAFNNSPRIQRDVDYFREKIGTVKTAGDLMKDYRLLRVALGAFGLEGEINSRFLVRKVLEEGATAQDALANKLSDKRFRAMADAFGFDRPVPSTQLSTFADDIVNSFQSRQFEVAVGEQDQNMRLALNLEREIDALVGSMASENGMWFTVMGTPPLRKVFEGAFALPTAFGALDVDRQLEIFKDKAQSTFGDKGVSQFKDPEKRQELIRMFLVRADLQSQAQSMSGASTALALLQTSASPRGMLF